MRSLIVLSAAAVALSGCANFRANMKRLFEGPNPCRSANAVAKGQSDSYNWYGYQPQTRSQGKCTAEYPYVNFKRDYTEAFNQSLAEACSSQVLKDATYRAERYQEQNTAFITRWCKRSAVARYRRHYRRKLRAACEPGYLRNKGYEDGRSNTNLTAGISAKCSRQALRAYRRGHEKGYLVGQVERQRQQMEQMQAQIQNEREERARREEKKARRREKRRSQRAFLRSFKTRCKVRNGKGIISVTNLTDKHLSFSGNWKITYLNKGAVVGTDTEYESLSLWRGETERFEDWGAPSSAKRCRARYIMAE